MKNLKDIIYQLEQARNFLGYAVEDTPSGSDLRKETNEAWESLDTILAALGEGGAEPDYDENGNWN